MDKKESRGSVHGSDSIVSSSTSKWSSNVDVKEEDKSIAADSTSSASSASSKIAQDQSFTAADSNSGSSNNRSSVPCKVCGDKASGYHYGVTSCEGCKGFFRRSIQKQIEYRCLRDGKCLVIRASRNRCQHCRFKKCMSVGMSRDSVRYGRVPKRSRERNGETDRVIVSEADQSVWKTDGNEKNVLSLIRTITDVHRTFCAYTEDKTRNLSRKPAVFSLDEFQGTRVDANSNTADSLEQKKIVMWQHFAALLAPSIQRIVEIAKRAPGFDTLTQDDQIILIKQGFFEIWLVHISRQISSSDNTITFNDGCYITKQQVELMFDYDFVCPLFNFAANFNNLQLNDTEIALLSTIVLLMSDRTGIYDHKVINQQQEKVLEALKYQLVRNHPDNPHIYQSVMVKLPELRNLGTKHAEHLLWFRANWAQLNLPPLFAETFDIPDGGIQQ